MSAAVCASARVALSARQRLQAPPRALSSCASSFRIGGSHKLRLEAYGRLRRRQAAAAAAAPLVVVARQQPGGDRDDDKEARLRRFRIVYTFASWSAHRSTKRYWRHFAGIFRSRILAGIALPLLLIFLEATAVCLYETALKAGMLPAACRTIQVKAPMLFSLSSFALSLLLVFRTNQSYARFDEGRRLWSVMVNRCRDALRQAVSYLGVDPGQAALLGTLSRWIQAFPWILKNHVRERVHWEDELTPLLQPKEMEVLLASPSPPLFALQVLTELLDRAPISAKQRLRIDGCVTDLSDVVGACERILNTPIPVSYTRHTCRYLVIWLALLPLSIFQQCGWVTVFSSVILGFFLLAIEEIGVTIEEPFNILPLEDLIAAGDVAQNVRQMDTVVQLVDGMTGTPRQPLHGMPVALPME